MLDLAVNKPFDIVALCETRISNNITLNTPGYTCYRQDKHRSGRGQGVALLVRTNIQHTEVRMPLTTHIEAVGIELTSTANKNLIVISIYQSPNLKFIPNDLDKLLNLGPNVLIMGDFNAKHKSWSCSQENKTGNVLYNHMINRNFIIQAPSTPTLVHYRLEHKPSTPDLVISKNVHSIENIHTLSALSSNHLPISFCISDEFQRNNKIFYNYSNADWTIYRTVLDENISLTSSIYKSPVEVDLGLEQLTNAMYMARDTSIPISNHDLKPKPLPRRLKKLIRIKNRLRRKDASTTNIQERKPLRHTINHMQCEINLRINKFNDKIWNDKLDRVDNPSTDIWRVAKGLRSKRNPIPPLLKPDNTTTSNVKEQCELLAESFLNNMALTTDWVSTPDIEAAVNSSSEIIKNFIPDKQQYFVKPRVISCQLAKLKKRKSPGEDNIQNELLKNLSRKAIVFLTQLFNACLRLSYFPLTLKSAKIVAILKPGKTNTLPISYRPISLLPSLGKLFESVIYSYLLKESKHLLINEQFGFREQHSTVQQLVRVTEHITHQINLKESTGMFLLDIEKAFDTVWHAGLLHKLYTYGVNLALIKLISSYLCDRQFTVNINSISSEPRRIPAGVPQGSVLGPYLFLLYLNDIPIQPHTKLACFADDTASFTSSKDVNLIIDRLQLSLSNLVTFFTDWKLKLNETKTEAILFTRSRKVPQRRLKILNHQINWSPNAKYLGVMLDSKINWSQHINYTKTKAIKAMGALNVIFNRKSKLSSSSKLRIYTTLIRPCLTYAAPVWSSTCQTNYNKIQVIQNKALKISYNTPFRTNLYKLHETINLPTLKQFILKLTKHFYKKIQLKHPNKLVNSLGQTRSHDLPYIDKYKRYRLPHHWLLFNE